MLILGRKRVLPWKPLERKGWGPILSIIQLIWYNSPVLYCNPQMPKRVVICDTWCLDAHDLNSCVYLHNDCSISTSSEKFFAAGSYHDEESKHSRELSWHHFQKLGEKNESSH